MVTLFALLAGLVALTWLASLLLAALQPAQTRPGRPPFPKVTAIVPAYQEEATLTACLAALRASRPAAAEVLVVDDGSTDRTAEVALAALAGWPEARLLRLPRNGGKAAALNAGLAEARCPLVLTLDADTLLAPDCLAWALAALRGQAAVACNLRALQTGWLARLQAAEYLGLLNLERRAQARLGWITTLPGAATLWRRRQLLALGGFSGRTLCEDTDITLAAQRRALPLGYAERALAHTLTPQSLPALLRQRSRWFWGNAACALLHLREGPLGPRFAAIAGLFALLNLASLPVLLLSCLSALALLLQGEAAIAGFGGLALLAAGLLRSLAAYRLERQPPPPPQVLLPSLLLMPLIVALAAAGGATRRLREGRLTWGRLPETRPAKPSFRAR